VCLRIRTFASSYLGKPKFEVTLRNGINLTDRSIPGGYRRPGRRPHVPSSKPTMSKSRRVSSPGLLVRASVSPTLMRRETEAEPVGSAAAAVTAIYVWRFFPSTAFCNFVAVAVDGSFEVPVSQDPVAELHIC
jgi:hypothetical protein